MRRSKQTARFARALACAAALVVVGLDPGPASAVDRSSEQTTLLVSRATTGDLPNGPSQDASISRDGRISRVVAFDSDATNLVASDTNGLTDVFIVNRAAPLTDGGDWLPGTTELISSGMGGTPANGRSYLPADDGQFDGPTDCVAFVSDASNLVPGDTNGKPDAFVYFLGSKRLERVSVNSKGKQANGSSYDVALDGRCDHVAFTSDATNLALTKARKRHQAGAVTKRVKKPTKEVYVRQLKATRSSGDIRQLNGITFLVSANGSHKPANGDSFDPSFAYRWNGSNHRIAYTSTATNLSKADSNTRPDIYASDLFAARHRTFLVSQTPSGTVGDGPSSHPSAGEAGNNVTYETEATNLLDNDNDGFSDIAQADLPGGRDGPGAAIQGARAARAEVRPVRQKWVTKDYNQNATRPDGTQTNISNGPSHNPEVSSSGDYVTYDTDADDFEGEPSDTETMADELAEPGDQPLLTKSPFCESQAADFDDRNGVKDVMLFTFTRKTNFLESRTSNKPLEQLRLPSSQPAISTRGNYIPYQTHEPYADLNWIRARHPEWLPDQCDDAALAVQDGVRATAAATPSFQQIYMRWTGPA
jgi:hypothetical protein